MRSKSGPGGYLYHYGLCELAQRQAVLVRKDKPSDRAIKSDRAKVVMTAGCISRIFGISTLTLPYGVMCILLFFQTYISPLCIHYNIKYKTVI